MEPTLESIVETYFPEPKPGLDGLFVALAILLAIAFAPLTFFIATLPDYSLGGVAWLVVSLLPSAACMVWARFSGRRIHKEILKMYPAQRAELLAGRIKSVVVTTGPKPGVGVSLENGEELGLWVHPDDCLYVRDALHKIITGNEWPRDPSAIPELEDIADLYLRDLTLRGEFVRGMFIRADVVGEVYPGTRMRGANKAVRVTFLEGKQTDLVVAPRAVYGVHAVVKRHIPVTS